MIQGITKEKFTEYIRKFDFQNLFIDLGWDHYETSGRVIVGESWFQYKVIAKLHGFFIIVVSSTHEREIPLSSIRKQISTSVSKTFPENLLIFHGEKTQYWSYRIQVDNDKERYSETVFYSEKEAEALFQRASGLFFQLDEYDRITFVDVKSRVRKGFTVNYDAVTKRFYDHFKREHESFKKAIEGIIDENDLDWYTSVTLNRLMFCYFIQKKGFLDSDTNYLQNKLQLFINQEDDTGFFSFYLDFLMVLFHDGLGGRERDQKKRALLGNIPYLNGGMFEVHELEQKYDSIKIHNAAFKEIFDFFDQYKWHLDINPDAPGNEINPDVLGYIFEKYINQRAEMGAYYTKEDITGYIGKSTILPFLFDEVKRKYPDPFKEQGEVWQFLKNSGDKFIYPAMKFGIPESALASSTSDGLFDNLQDEMKIGLDPEQKDLWKIRKPWNKPAPNDIALPTEIYREVIERRNRYKEIKSLITSDSIKEINDLITYNLDIINFTEDLLTNTEDSKLVEHFYKAIEKVTILDPTCGSGAFLFSAMNILEPLYEILIERMRSFVYDEDRINADKYSNRKGGFLYKYPYFREILGKVSGLKDPNDPESGQNHPNQKYFILKSIILNNLYGVDIMREAVEIAKLRLFLKLVAQVHPNPNEENLGIEPLPDMDFNLKAGNTLVGFGTIDDMENLSNLLITEQEKTKIYDECDSIAHIFEAFKSNQLESVPSNNVKDLLRSKIIDLNKRLNQLLYVAQFSGTGIVSWVNSHQPFHWFAEFYQIIFDKKGFDIVIGNPPYVEHTALKQYSLKGFNTLSCGNLFANVVERSLILSNSGRIGFILPISLTCSKRMGPLQKLLLLKGGHISNFAWRPSKLFEGADKANLSLSIVVLNGTGLNFTSTYKRWNAEARGVIFSTLSYVHSATYLDNKIIPKIGNQIEKELLNKLVLSKRLNTLISQTESGNRLYYRRTGGLYWKIFTTFRPILYLNGELTYSSKEEYLVYSSEKDKFLSLLLFWSDFYWWWYQITSDVRNNNPSDLLTMPIPNFELQDSEIDLIEEFEQDLKTNSILDQRVYKGNISKFQKFFPKKSRNYIERFNDILSSKFDLDEITKDYVMNYDLKYRMGADEEEE